MLSYNFAESSDTQDTTKYAPVLKLPNKDRDHHRNNAIIRFGYIGWGNARPLDVQFYVPATSESAIELHKLNNSPIDIFARVDDDGQYITVYEKIPFNGRAVVTFVIAENANMFTPIWAGKYEYEYQNGDTVADTARINEPVFTEFRNTTRTTGNTANIATGIQPSSYDIISASSSGHILIPFIAVGQWLIKTFDTDMQPLNNTEVTYDVVLKHR